MKIGNCRGTMAIGLVSALLLILPQTAMAHRVLLFAWVESGMVNVEGGFGSGKPAKDCVLKAFDSAQKLVFTGKTDDGGRCAFPVPKGHTGEMILELEAGPGHKGSWTLAADEFTSAAPADQAAEHQRVMDTGPDPLKIGAGIGIIFALAVIVGLLRKKKGAHA